MAEDTTYGRLEKKLDNVQSDIKILSEKVLELTIINNNHQTQGSLNTRRIDSVESQLDQANGIISLIRWCGLPILFAISGFIWNLHINQNVTAQRISDSRQEVGQIISDAKQEVALNRAAINNLKIKSTTQNGEYMNEQR